MPIQYATPTAQRASYDSLKRSIPDPSQHTHCSCGRRASGPIFSPKNGRGHRFCVDHQPTTRQSPAALSRILARRRLELAASR